MTTSESVALEAYEQAGVKGDVSSHSVGTYKNTKTVQTGSSVRWVKIYSVKITRVRHHRHEKAQHQLKWMTIDAEVCG